MALFWAMTPTCNTWPPSCPAVVARRSSLCGLWRSSLVARFSFALVARASSLAIRSKRRDTSDESQRRIVARRSSPVALAARHSSDVANKRLAAETAACRKAVLEAEEASAGEVASLKRELAARDQALQESEAAAAAALEEAVATSSAAAAAASAELEAARAEATEAKASASGAAMSRDEVESALLAAEGRSRQLERERREASRALDEALQSVQHEQEAARAAAGRYHIRPLRIRH